MSGLLRVLLMGIIEAIIKKLDDTLRRIPPQSAKSPQSPRPAESVTTARRDDTGWTQPQEMARGSGIALPVVPLRKTDTPMDATPQTPELSARALRRRLRDPRTLRQAVVVNELLAKPLALRRRQ
jgi:hypothetical protein